MRTDSSTDVVILCGGLGKRLRTVVSDVPKPMAAVGGIPFLFLLTDHLFSFGFCRFVLCVGYRSDIVETFFKQARFPYEIELSYEPLPLGTGGALRNAAGKLRSDPVLVLNGDSFCGLDYPDFLAAHETNKAAASIAVVEVERAGEYGSIRVGKDRRIEEFAEKSASIGGGYVNAGIYAFGRDTIGSMDTRVPLSLETDVFPGLTRSRLFAYFAAGPLLDIGTPERYREAEQKLAALMTRSRGRKSEVGGQRSAGFARWLRRAKDVGNRDAG